MFIRVKIAARVIVEILSRQVSQKNLFAHTIYIMELEFFHSK